MITTNQKYIVNIHRERKKESKYNTKESHQITGENNNRKKKIPLFKTAKKNSKRLICGQGYIKNTKNKTVTAILHFKIYKCKE